MIEVSIEELTALQGAIEGQDNELAKRLINDLLTRAETKEKEDAAPAFTKRKQKDADENAPEYL